MFAARAALERGQRAQRIANTDTMMRKKRQISARLPISSSVVPPTLTAILTNSSNSNTGLFVSLQHDHDFRPSWKTWSVK